MQHFSFLFLFLCIFQYWWYICGRLILTHLETTRTITAAEFGKPQKTSKEVCAEIAADFKLRGMTHADAAKRLGVTRQVVTIQLSGKRYFGKKTATKYCQEFNYYYPFLVSGIGMLYNDPAMNDILLQREKSDSEISVELNQREQEYQALVADLHKATEKIKELEEQQRNYESEKAFLKEELSKLKEKYIAVLEGKFITSMKEDIANFAK